MFSMHPYAVHVKGVCFIAGIVLICAVLTNALVLVCIVAAHLSMSGMSSAGMSGGFNINAQIPFQGTELQQVRPTQPGNTVHTDPRPGKLQTHTHTYLHIPSDGEVHF